MIKRLFAGYDRFCDQRLEVARFQPEAVWEILPEDKTEEGKSFEGRPLYQIERGEGKTKVLLWTQMHGNEPTATFAVLDVLKFLDTEETDSKYIRTTILENLHLRFLPIINPDGLARFQRRTAQGIDMNRDFERADCPESQFLKAQAEGFQPDWGFNLHDQNRYYAVGDSSEATVLAFLAPPSDRAISISGTRREAMQLLGKLMTDLQTLLPNKIARYSDEFERRAFGDNFQRLDIRTVLFEGGFLPDDPEKQKLRKYYFVALVAALYKIATKSFIKTEISVYQEIPENKSRFFDVLCRDLTISSDGKTYQTDLAFNRLENNNFQLMEMGDLRAFCGHQTYEGLELSEMSSLLVVEGKGSLRFEGNAVRWDT
ncbi:MAG: M14 family zinc carboxypeptidase [Bacteroidota bacterium]